MAFVARPGFEPRHTEPKSVVLPLYYQAIRPILLEWAAKIGLGVNCSKFFNSKKTIFFLELVAYCPDDSLSFNSLILSKAPATTSHMMVYKAPGL